MNATPPGMSGPSGTALWQQRLHRFSAGAVRAFHAYGTWLVSITWRRFIVLALLLIIVMAIVHDSPPFTWTITERVEDDSPQRVVVAPPAPRLPPAPRPPRDIGEVQININKDGIRITPRSAQPRPRGRRHWPSRCRRNRGGGCGWQTWGAPSALVLTLCF